MRYVRLGRRGFAQRMRLVEPQAQRSMGSMPSLVSRLQRTAEQWKLPFLSFYSGALTVLIISGVAHLSRAYLDLRDMRARVSFRRSLSSGRRCAALISSSRFSGKESRNECVNRPSAGR
ncbi:BQ5605_C022g09572 [Microbotryum silenes-dioicae]|uniref:BQ5605_C022g09572 protein n=1 Tax=Microbotryum silenes-dioicae TaxID=796604 RepID=A0A2X0PET4_9BASI|nr:BQ5605_C022g09572 [Microbotryum silenes-dioicae]